MLRRLRPLRRSNSTFPPRQKPLHTTPGGTRTPNPRFRRNGIFVSNSVFAVVKIMGNPAKCRNFPPQTTLSLYSISVQSQQRKPIFSPQNPYFPTIFSENPYKPIRKILAFCGIGEECGDSARKPEKTPGRQDFALKTFKNTILRAFLRRRGCTPVLQSAKT